MRNRLCIAVALAVLLLLTFQSSIYIYQNNVQAQIPTPPPTPSPTPTPTASETETPNATETETPSDLPTPTPTEEPTIIHWENILPLAAVGILAVVIAVPLVLLRRRTYLVTFGQEGVGHDYTNPVLNVDGVSYDKYGTSFWWNKNSNHSFEYFSPLNASSGKQYILTSISGLPHEQNNILVRGNNTIVGNYKLQLTSSVFEARPNPKRKPFYTP
jgi:hypothetical protein